MIDCNHRCVKLSNFHGHITYSHIKTHLLYIHQCVPRSQNVQLFLPHILELIVVFPYGSLTSFDYKEFRLGTEEQEWHSNRSCNIPGLPCSKPFSPACFLCIRALKRNAIVADGLIVSNCTQLFIEASRRLGAT